MYTGGLVPILGVEAPFEPLARRWKVTTTPRVLPRSLSPTCTSSERHIVMDWTIRRWSRIWLDWRLSSISRPGYNGEATSKAVAAFNKQAYKPSGCSFGLQTW